MDLYAVCTGGVVHVHTEKSILLIIELATAIKNKFWLAKESMFVFINAGN